MNESIPLYSTEWIANQRIAGRCVAVILAELSEKMKEDRVYTGKELNDIAVAIFPKFGCTATFLNYRGFPASICLSINKELVHGIPKNLPIVEGDVVSFDLGATFKGAIGDAAVTVIKGKAKDKRHLEIIDVCKKALKAGIDSIKVGEKIGCIGYAIHNVVKGTPYGLVNHYGGHHIETNKPHALPYIPNKNQKTEGVRAQVGETFAIEPMVMIGDTRTRVLADGWTVVGDDVSAHEEATVIITEDGPYVQTQL